METLKVQIRKNIYDKLKALAKNNRIPMEILTNFLLSRMLNDNHKEIPQIIQKVKNENGKTQPS